MNITTTRILFVVFGNPKLSAITRNPLGIYLLVACWLASVTNLSLQSAEPIDIGNRLELFVDDYLIDRMDGAERRLHHPIPSEIAVNCDLPWEGNGVNHITVFQDNDRYRMYYRGVNTRWAPGKIINSSQKVCYAESHDGIHWTKPKIGLFDYDGSKENNIVWSGEAVHNFTPFKDSNPDCNPNELYKAVGGGLLLAFTSPDGIHWSQLSDKPIITTGSFDSQNVAFWDPNRGEYREYHRHRRNGRDIMTATSKDFVDWTEPVFLDYVPGRMYQLYTNQITPYGRAPHIFLGFPTRYHDPGWTASTDALPQVEYRKVRTSISAREGSALTDGLLMSSRDGQTFQVWPERLSGPDRSGRAPGSTATITRTGDWLKHRPLCQTHRRSFQCT